MGRELAANLWPLLRRTGRGWPAQDETALVTIAGIWGSTAVELRKKLDDADQHLGALESFSSAAVAVRREELLGRDAARDKLVKSAWGADEIRKELLVCAKVIETLKKNCEAVLELLHAALADLDQRTRATQPQPSADEVQERIDELYTNAGKALDTAEKIAIRSLRGRSLAV
jgi:hypothetical protein